MVDFLHWFFLMIAFAAFLGVIWPPMSGLDKRSDALYALVGALILIQFVK